MTVTNKFEITSTQHGLFPKRFSENDSTSGEEKDLDGCAWQNSQSRGMLLSSKFDVLGAN
jgi:hypothetical protein